MGVVRNIVNNDLLRLSYSEPKNIRKFLKNWGGLENLCLKGDTVAICILADLKVVTGIEISLYNKNNRTAFNAGYKKGRLSFYQYMSIAYVLVLGYSQEDIAYVMGVDQSVISRNIRSGINKIIKELGENDGEKAMQNRRCGG